MYIENVKIGSFGKLFDREFELAPGINIIEGKNESGKSTLCEFIKFVFYGLSNKSQNGGMSERKRHISWKTNGVSGSVVLNTGDKKYRIERSMIAHGTGYKDEITVVDLDTNSVISGIKNPGEHFFGIPEDVFTHTVYIRQSEGAYFDGGDIGQAVENIFYSADESVNTDKALKKLDEARVMIKHKKNTGRGMMDGLEKAREELSFRLDEARRANEEIRTVEASLRKNTAAAEKNRNDGERLAEILRKTELHGIIENFGKRKSYSSAIDRFQKGKEEISAAATYNGFFPDSRYLAEAAKLKNELVFLKESESSYEVEPEDLEVDVYSKELAGIIKDQGGKDAFLDKLSGFLRKSKVYKTLSIVFCAVALVALIGGLFFGGSGISVAMYILCGAGVIASVGCAVSLLGIKGRIKSFCERFDVEDVYGLFAVIERIDDCRLAEIKRNEMLAYREARKRENEKKICDTVGSAVRLLEKWGITPDSAESDDVIKILDGVAEDVADIKKNIAIYDREIEKNKAVLAELESYLEGYDEKAVTEEYSALECEMSDNIEETKKRYSFTVKARDVLTEKISTLEKRLAELKAVNENPSDLESRLRSVNERIDELEIKHAAYVLAYEKLQSAGTALRNKLAPGLSAVSGTLMDGLTDGKYKEIGVSDDLEMTYSFEEEGAVYTKTIDCVSSGTQDIAYISLRLALAALFGKSGKKLPVIFDEAFSRLDGDRLANMLEIADRYSESGAQILVMTSHERERVCLEQKGKSETVNCLTI